METDQNTSAPEGTNTEADESLENAENARKANEAAAKPRGNLKLEPLPKKLIPIHQAENHEKLGKLQAIFVNDPKLSDFKSLFVEKGFKAEFLSGTLLIKGGKCSIRRGEMGFSMEGALEKDYYKLRNLFFNQFGVL
ncbi:hypothetical protein GCK72_002881 [Caenorhabditis remanei]|uniref:Cleavage and polyadenylation specificity factor subunit 2 n=1 Tax=Caenorhabditis remanei TaxID=31234 RepID=A0A6A5HW38_CAERE|nr:hypothetical protein GCK72_002881 [Caenorhabditis remanei]KAF1771056.1 hypothetical protein GCK72_002881 [Caenorhabditis remanei]